MTLGVVCMIINHVVRARDSNRTDMFEMAVTNFHAISALFPSLFPTRGAWSPRTVCDVSVLQRHKGLERNSHLPLLHCKLSSPNTVRFLDENKFLIIRS